MFSTMGLISNVKQSSFRPEKLNWVLFVRNKSEFITIANAVASFYALLPKNTFSETKKLGLCVYTSVYENW